MSLFTKKESHHYVRDEAGNVTKVMIESDKPLFGRKPKKKSVFKQLEKQYYQQHPEETRSYKVKESLKKAGQRLDKYADDYAKSHGYPTKKKGSKKQKPKTQYHIKGGKAYPIAKPPAQKKQRPREPSFDFFSGDSDLFFGTEFYGSSKKGKKKKQSGMDFFDNRDFF